ncbi:MAG TPA: hypothetical protein VF486_27695 [Actinomycetes bacterium]
MTGRGSGGRRGIRLRRTADPEVEAAWESFCALASALDEGSRALLATVPSARRPGAPLEAAIAGFLAGTEAARAELPGWALPELAAAQAATAAALDAAQRRARDLTVATAGLDFEHRNEAVGEVLDQLAPIQDAEQALRRLRRRRPSRRDREEQDHA